MRNKKTFLTIAIQVFVLIGVTNAQLPSWLPKTGLVAWYPFNGSVDDESGNNRNGTAYNGVTITNDRKGNHNSACHFDFTGRIECDGFPTDFKAYTVSGWFKFEKTFNKGWNLFSLMGYDFLGQESRCFGISVFMKKIFISHRVSQDENIEHLCNNIPIDAFWNFVTMTWDGKMIRVYYNGVQKDSLQCLFRHVMLPKFEISSGHPTTDYLEYTTWGGLTIDDVAVHNRALSHSEILEIYNEGNTGSNINSTSPNAISSSNLDNWSIQPSVSTASLKSISFPSSDIGFTVGYNGEMLKTINGGISWEKLSTGTNLRLTSVYYSDANNGYIATSNGSILKTTNGGISWTVMPTGASGINSLFFTNSNTGYAVGTNCMIYKTVDAGRSWIKCLNKIETDVNWAVYQGATDYNALNSVYFTGLNNGFAVGNGGRMFKTTNGGISWKKRVIGDGNITFWSVYFKDSQTGFVVGNDGTILKTTDGGENWNKIISGIKSCLWSICFVNKDRGYIVGNSGTLFTTNDGGETWIFNHINENDLFSVFSNNRNSGIIVGGKGTIMKATF
jgi:photosystem II stability/assembly factor-like uncharacterized protein